MVCARALARAHACERACVQARACVRACVRAHAVLPRSLLHPARRPASKGARRLRRAWAAAQGRSPEACSHDRQEGRAAYNGLKHSSEALGAIWRRCRDRVGGHDFLGVRIRHAYSARGRWAWSAQTVVCVTGLCGPAGTRRARRCPGPTALHLARTSMSPRRGAPAGPARFLRAPASMTLS